VCDVGGKLLEGTLILASDGFWDVMKPEELLEDLK
jgi:serine/threonine protein phosphatase PrpC